MSHQWQAGFDLRSRCLLVPKGPFTLELVGAGEVTPFRLSPNRADALLEEAAGAAAAVGLSWKVDEPFTLFPNAELEKAVRKSWAQAAVSE